MEKQIDYAEQLLEAMKVVSKAEVQGVQFDRTIQCTVTGIEDADHGIYTVDNGSASFIAYSKDTDYKLKDNVLVTIPQGDYNQQKIIIGKFIAKNSKPFVYKSPFDYFVDITGNLIRGDHGEYSILANDVENDIICPEGPVGYWSCLGAPSDIPLTGYDTIGLKAEFLTLLKGFKVTSGNYGLRVLVTYKQNGLNVANDVELENQFQTDLNSTNGRILNKKINYCYNNASAGGDIEPTEQEQAILTSLYNQKAFYLTINDMYGDPYDFDTYCEQQILFDISGIDQIVTIQVDLYQSWEEEDGERVGTFKDEFGDRISCFDEVFTDERYMDNIFVKDVYLSLGYEESKFTDDRLILYTKNNMTYSSTEDNTINLKNMSARWIHKDETGEILIVEDLSSVPNAHLRWYRFVLSEGAADVYCGVHWVAITDTDDHPFYAILTDDGWGCEMLCNPELAQDQVKAILTYGADHVIRSNILTFTNEVDVPNIPAVQQLDDFYLEPTDEYHGVYNFYGNDNKILTETVNENGEELEKPFYPQNRVGSLVTMLKGSQLSDIEYIKWSIPWDYTMLTPTNAAGDPLFTVEYDSTTNKNKPIINSSNITIWQYDYDENYVYLLAFGENLREDFSIINASNFPKNPALINDFKKIPHEDQFDWNFYYKIKDTFIKTHTNNAITCEVIKDRMIYSYTFNFRFGYNSTNGSDYTLLLSFAATDKTKMPETAMQVFDNNNTSSLKVHLDIMDQHGSLLDWHNQTLFNNNVIVTWDWAVCINRQSYVTDYIEVAHDDIPFYRKLLSDINIITPAADGQDEVQAVPLYYYETSPTNHPVASGPYDDQTDSDGRYLTKYYARIYKRVSEENDSHIFFYNPNTTTLYRPNVDTQLQEILLSSSDNPNAKLQMDELYVLRVTVAGFLPYDLVSYLPIPLYKKYGTGNNAMKPNYVGPDMVRYNSLGETDYYKDPCKITWIASDNRLFIHAQDEPGVTEKFEIFIPISKVTDYNTNQDARDYGTLDEKYVLKPLNVYLQENPPYGIQYMIGNNPYYTQPIFCYQNQWPNGTVNAWDGTGLIINDEAGYIMGHSITAGKKEDDNTFTGVMLGDLGVYKNTEAILTKTTGVYGFHHGAISYAFLDDGTGYIGKSGRGRIEFDGNHGIIRSSAWTNPQQPQGMMIDLDDGIIKMIKPGYYSVVDVDRTTYEANESDYYKEVLYKLYYADANQIAIDKADPNMEFYLPRTFLDPPIPVTDQTYVRYKFYRQYIEEVAIPNNDIPTNDNLKQKKTETNGYILDSTITTSETNRVTDVYINNNRHIGMTVTESIWKYDQVVSETVNNETIEYYICHLTKQTIYKYILSTNASYVAPPASNQSNTFTYVLPDFSNFTIITDEELEAWNFTARWFYTRKGEFVQCTNDDPYDVYDTYYQMGQGDHYITVSVDHSTYPLSIGTDSAEGLRKFRVTWDGYVYAEHGRFTGTIRAQDGYLNNLEIAGRLYTKNYLRYITSSSPKTGIFGAYIEGGQIYGTSITAKELYCDLGELGGWYVGNNGLWNQAYETRSGSEGSIYLGSRGTGIELYKTAIYYYNDNSKRNSSNGYGMFGAMASSFGSTPGGDTRDANGIGLQYIQTRSGGLFEGQWKTTGASVGGGIGLHGTLDGTETINNTSANMWMSYDIRHADYGAGIYARDHVNISTGRTDSSPVTYGGTYWNGNRTITLSTNEIALWAQTLFRISVNTSTSNVLWIQAEANGLSSLHINNSLIPANQQFGIYARFA